MAVKQFLRQDEVQIGKWKFVCETFELSQSDDIWDQDAYSNGSKYRFNLNVTDIKKNESKIIFWERSRANTKTFRLEKHRQVVMALKDLRKISARLPLIEDVLNWIILQIQPSVTYI